MHDEHTPLLIPGSIFPAVGAAAFGPGGCPKRQAQEARTIA